MAEQIQEAINISNVSAPSDTVASSSVTSSSQESVASAAPVITETKAEKMLSQSEVNDLVGRVKHEASEKTRKEVLKELQDSMIRQGVPQNNAQPQYQQQGMIGGMQQQSQMQPGYDNGAAIRAEVARMAAQSRQEQVDAGYRQVATDFYRKMEEAKTKYPDFKEVTDPLQIDDLPITFVQMLNSVENPADVLYEFAKNPVQFANISSLAYSRPKLAENALRGLSDSIKKNEAALKQPKAPEPLSPIRPSHTGSDNGKMSVSELREQDWLRG